MLDERSRFALHARLVETLGEDHAVTLMSHLPPVGWADVATRHDVEALGREMHAGFGRLDARIDRLEHALNGLEDRVGRLEEQLERLEGRIEGFDERLDARTRLFIGTTIGAVFSAVLTTAGVVVVAL